ncbi:hypothetical protein [Salmonirosea aquatica]|uniref:hypothetical protein n=1 Tax=Salmonirosea aquatica TaxID=2654236 RepID=UPI003570F2E8
MSLIRSKFDTDYDNRPLELSLVRKIKLSPASPKNKGLWILRFYGLDENQNDEVLRSWFYTTNRKRMDDLRGILKNNPQIIVCQVQYSASVPKACVPR